MWNSQYVDHAVTLTRATLYSIFVCLTIKDTYGGYFPTLDTEPMDLRQMSSTVATPIRFG